MVQDLYATLVALASKSSVVPYDRLMAALGINNERQLEDFVIQAIYQDIIQGRLNPVKRCLEVTDWTSDRLGDTDLQFMADTLTQWGTKCNQFVCQLAEQVNDSNKFVADAVANEKRLLEDAEAVKKNLNLDEYGHSRNRGAWGDFGGPGSSGGGFFRAGGGQKPDTKRFKSGGMNKKRGGHN